MSESNEKRLKSTQKALRAYCRGSKKETDAANLTGKRSPKKATFQYELFPPTKSQLLETQVNSILAVHGVVMRRKKPNWVKCQNQVGTGRLASPLYYTSPKITCALESPACAIESNELQDKRSPKSSTPRQTSQGSTLLIVKPHHHQIHPRFPSSIDARKRAVGTESHPYTHGLPPCTTPGTSRSISKKDPPKKIPTGVTPRVFCQSNDVILPTIEALLTTDTPVFVLDNDPHE
ncbi:hypothetical protein BASA50_009041 [Batrachochytrium salamandrivorans]|uniref:Uncharacterized protein n=1 Tax=Batrachochytrium salamandrivorans TaxID=1357716 RepID=A0ABQ8F2N4_9FUNG|nr:hypothetical protein BASA62_004359 [Batrachochytrium salamandrivorans]KAH6575862.1 hypothetical protein BASA60_004801 [Batrachochytrium salamandrivorans]KAH6578476.1 hypothetical protein BASA61_000234 [Batrachochytrium salamandrivorans]KAH6591040.1 hypothetical protein BASA50_009041 [Batrachochytrium salamandrivorans]KAH9277311.1 hypothetical protein BASA83_000178 [Batrachochytrium salamandrivorans]